ncbi:MAG: serine acetyltransferase, partial [Desulfovibrionaceae bacterium]|nr:serine acetyltransferase [Desulfovibrionaceae bacterium]
MSSHLEQDNAGQAVSMPVLDTVVERLCHPSSLDRVWHRPARGAAMPSLDVLREIMERLRAALFPGYFGGMRVRRESMRYHLSANLDSIYHKLSEQILRGFCFSCEGKHADRPCEACEREGAETALAFMDKLPEIRRLLAGDAQAAYEGDPAATSPGEAIFCYPSMRAMLHHRIGHELYRLKVPLIP